MAEPVDFPESNLILTGTPEDRAAGTVVDLPIHRYQDLDGNWHVISKWRLTPEELKEVRETGGVWLHSWGHTHPPIAVAGATPFVMRPCGYTEPESDYRDPDTGAHRTARCEGGRLVVRGNGTDSTTDGTMFITSRPCPQCKGELR